MNVDGDSNRTPLSDQLNEKHESQGRVSDAGIIIVFETD
jgi:hypothetical protein